jgi:type VI secretion system secreted protein Hcp
MAESWFLKIDGIEGESTDQSHKGEIDVLAWSWGVSQAGTTATGTGGGAGKASFQDFHFVSQISKASPKLFLAAASGSHIKWAALGGVRGSGKSKSDEFLKYKLSDIIVSSVQHSDAEGGPPTEQFSLNYSKIEMTYSSQAPSGKLGPSVSAGWNVFKNVKL